MDTRVRRRGRRTAVRTMGWWGWDGGGPLAASVAGQVYHNLAVEACHLGVMPA